MTVHHQWSPNLTMCSRAISPKMTVVGVREEVTCESCLAALKRRINYERRWRE